MIDYLSDKVEDAACIGSIVSPQRIPQHGEISAVEQRMAIDEKVFIFDDLVPRFFS